MISQNYKCRIIDFFVKIIELNPTNPILVNLISQRIKEIREQHNHTQEYVTNNTHLNIWHYESQQQFPTLESITRFCKFYNISLKTFFGEMNYPEESELK